MAELKYYWCEDCQMNTDDRPNCRWNSDKEVVWCPRNPNHTVRRTMTPEEAEERGLLKD